MQAKKISEKGKSIGNEAIIEKAELHWEKAKSDVEDMKMQFEKTKGHFLSDKYNTIELVLNKPLPRFSLLPGFITSSSLYEWLDKEGYLDAGPKRKEQERKVKQEA